LSIVAPILLEALVFLSLLVSRFLLDVKLKLEGNLNLGVNSKLGHKLNLGGNLRLESITPFLDRMFLFYNLNLGTFLSNKIYDLLGGNIIKLTLFYPPKSINRL